MLRRSCRLPAARSCLLLGPRQTGKLDYRQAESRLYYWRTHNGAEVDLLIERHGQLRLAVEIKAKKRVSGAELSGLRSFAEAHPRVRRIVASEVAEPYRLQGVDVLPYRHFLERLPRLLA